MFLLKAERKFPQVLSTFSIMNAVFQKKASIEAFANQFEIQHIIWFLHDRMKECYMYRNKHQQPEIFRRLKFNETVINKKTNMCTRNKFFFFKEFRNIYLSL